MSWPFFADTASAVEFIMCVACWLMGLSHIVQPEMWRNYFTELFQQGARGIITRTFALELWPALLIVALHPVWSGPGIVLTFYGWLLLGKCTVSILVPKIGLQSLKLAQKGDQAFVAGGIVLIFIGSAAGLAFWWR